MIIITLQQQYRIYYCNLRLFHHHHPPPHHHHRQSSLSVVVAVAVAVAAAVAAIESPSAHQRRTDQFVLLSMTFPVPTATINNQQSTITNTTANCSIHNNNDNQQWYYVIDGDNIMGAIPKNFAEIIINKKIN